MSQKIELHDSQIQEVIVQEDCVKIVFDSLVILNVTDEFGFEFDKTTYSEGVFTIKHPQYKNLPTKGDISTGHLRVGECRYDLISIDFNIVKPCALFIAQESGHYKIFGQEFSVVVK